MYFDDFKQFASPRWQVALFEYSSGFADSDAIAYREFGFTFRHDRSLTEFRLVMNRYLRWRHFYRTVLRIVVAFNEHRQNIYISQRAGIREISPHSSSQRSVKSFN